MEVLQFMREKITRLEDGGKKSTAHNYSSALNSFRRFLCGKIVYADGVDGKLMTAYEHWLQEEKPGGKKLGENSSSFYLRHLRTIWHEMVATGMADRGNEDPFKNVFTGVKRRLNGLCLKLVLPGWKRRCPGYPPILHLPFRCFCSAIIREGCLLWTSPI